MSGIAGKKISPLSGIGPPGFWVNTELNWLLRMVALSGASDKVSPSLRRGGGGAKPDQSLRIRLLNDQN